MGDPNTTCVNSKAKPGKIKAETSILHSSFSLANIVFLKRESSSSFYRIILLARSNVPHMGLL